MYKKKHFSRPVVSLHNQYISDNFSPFFPVRYNSNPQVISGTYLDVKNY